MLLKEFVVHKRKVILEDLKNGKAPKEGKYDKGFLTSYSANDTIQLGAVKFQPYSMTLEYIFTDKQKNSHIFSVELEVPERIVFMPVPTWVIQSIWQGEIQGSYYFQTEAYRLLDEFKLNLEESQNLNCFNAEPEKQRS